MRQQERPDELRRVRATIGPSQQVAGELWSHMTFKENGYFGLWGAKIFFACGALWRAWPAAGDPPSIEHPRHLPGGRQYPGARRRIKCTGR